LEVVEVVVVSAGGVGDVKYMRVNCI